MSEQEKLTVSQHCTAVRILLSFPYSLLVCSLGMVVANKYTSTVECHPIFVLLIFLSLIFHRKYGQTYDVNFVINKSGKGFTQ